jgi:hypothetical protein
LKSHRRSIKRIACRALKALGRIFRVARNSTYKTEVLVKALILLCITNTSAERSSAPSPDTLLRRLRRVDEQDFIQMWWKQTSAS